MALKSYNPVTPSQRQLVLVDRSGLYRGAPVKTLTEGQSSSGGRNNRGRITVRFRGGGRELGFQGGIQMECIGDRGGERGERGIRVGDRHTSHQK